MCSLLEEITCCYELSGSVRLLFDSAADKVKVIVFLRNLIKPTEFIVCLFR